MELRVKNLCKAYDGRPVLQNVSLIAGPGITCLMGPSGAGKTTLLRILMGLEGADSGEVTGLQHVRISAVFQEDRLLELRTAQENLRFVMGRSYDARKAEALFSELGLTGIAEKPVRDFSGGMKRRTALARALSVPFDLLLLDEPFAGLDEENRRRAICCIQRHAAGKAVLLVTHQREDAVDFHANLVEL